MSLLIDTHSHQYSEQFLEDSEQASERAKSVLSHVFLPNIDLESIQSMLRLRDSAPDFYFPMMGLHPCSVKEDWKQTCDIIENWFTKDTFYGVGETGLDYYWDTTHAEEQKQSLQRHIDWAKEMQLPLILHCRKSLDDVIEMVRFNQNGKLRGIFHCFDGTLAQANKIIENGFAVGIGGVLTYKKSSLPTVVKEIPLEHIVLETDSPYLPPVPYRGKRNESSYVKLVAEKLAEVKSLSLQEISRITTDNALRIFQMN